MTGGSPLRLVLYGVLRGTSAAAVERADGDSGSSRFASVQGGHLVAPEFRIGITGDRIVEAMLACR